MKISDYLEEEAKAKAQHRLAVKYGEEFIKLKGLWDEFLEYATKEEAKLPVLSPWEHTD